MTTQFVPSTNFIQANLRKKVACTASIMKDLTPSTVLLLTEPQITKNKRIPGIPKSHGLTITSTGSRPRSAIVTPKGMYNNSMRLGHFSSPDVTTIRVTLNSHSVIICSAYFDITQPVRSQTIVDLFDHCNREKIPLLFWS